MSGARARLRRIGWILGLGVAISAAVLLGVTGASTTASEGGVVLEVLEASVSDGRLKAAVSVTNNDSIRHELDAYVSLGVFSGGSAWDRRVIESTHQIVPIRSGQETLVVWDEPVNILNGSYEPTAWVGLERGDGVVLQATGEESVDVSDNDEAARVVAAGASLITGVDVQVSGAELLTVRGSVSSEEAGELKVDVVRANAREPWWAIEAVKTAIVDADELTHEFDLLHALPPGDYMVRLQLLQEEMLVDQIMLPTVASVLDLGTARRDGPVAGDLAIVAVNVPDAEWAQPNEALVEIEVQNLSTEPVSGKFWWLLSAPGEPEPWRFVDARSFDVGRSLEPRERRTIRLAIDGLLPAGQGFELTVWSHIDTGSGETQHSDGVRVNQLIDIG